MLSLSVRDLPEQVYQTAQRLAHAQGRPLSGYLITLLEHAIADAATRPDQSACRRRTEVLARIRRRHEPPSGAPDVVALLRRTRGCDD